MIGRHQRTRGDRTEELEAIHSLKGSRSHCQLRSVCHNIFSAKAEEGWGARKHPQQACEIFAGLGATHDLGRAQAKLAPEAGPVLKLDLTSLIPKP